MCPYCMPHRSGSQPLVVPSGVARPPASRMARDCCMGVVPLGPSDSPQPVYVKTAMRQKLRLRMMNPSSFEMDIWPRQTYIMPRFVYCCQAELKWVKNQKFAHLSYESEHILTDTLKAWTDGACLETPGGWGVVLRWREHEKTLKGGEPQTTNNRMELMAAIKPWSSFNAQSQCISTQTVNT